jgi:hypothetical protein
MNKKDLVVSLLILVVFGTIGHFLVNKDKSKNTPNDAISIEVQGKIDINAVCEGALAYMTFSDGLSAETFVSECKEGKHPQVIEDFKKQMNLGDGANL